MSCILSIYNPNKILNETMSNHLIKENGNAKTQICKKISICCKYADKYKLNCVQLLVD